MWKDHWWLFLNIDKIKYEYDQNIYHDEVLVSWSFILFIYEVRSWSDYYRTEH